MSIYELFFIALALSMDAVAVSLCIGLSLQKFTIKHALVVGLYFGTFQAAMPIIGYFAGGIFAERITAYDHWVVFILLTLLGGNMIVSGFKKVEGGKVTSLKVMVMIPLALATSIDAMAAGISFAFARVSIVPAIALVGVVTLTLSAIGVRVGGSVGVKFKSKAEFFGGAVLIAMGIRSLVLSL